MAKKWIVAPPGKGKKWPNNWKIAFLFNPFLEFFGHFCPISPVGPKSIFRPFFSHFGPPGLVLGNQDCKANSTVLQPYFC